MFLKQGAKGEYWSGNVTETIPAGARLFLFRNNKRKDSDPEMTLHFVTDEPQPPMRRAEPQRQQQPSRAPRGYSPETIKSFIPTDDDEQIPL